MKSGKGSRRVGLARALSKLGICSRSQAVEWIRAGRVSLNGVIRRGPENPVHLGKDRIEVDGQSIASRKKIYLMLNKPRGKVTTATDEKGRQTVFDLLEKDLLEKDLLEKDLLEKDLLSQNLPWVAPVGRLDKASEGLLLLTNDSEWAGRVLAPETHLEKIYHVQIGAIADDKLLAAMTSGIRCDSEWLRAKRASVIRTGEKNSWIEVVLEEGKYRQIRRMLAQLDVEVLRLVRVAIGPLKLGELAKGETRNLSSAEKRALDAAMRRKHFTTEGTEYTEDS